MTHPGHEPPTIAAGPIVATAAGLAAVVALAMAIAMVLTESMAGRATSPLPFPLESQARDDQPAPPRLEQIDRLAKRPTGIHADVLRRAPGLDSYDWADEKKSLVRIPIERAMKILVDERRLPARKGGAK